MTILRNLLNWHFKYLLAATSAIAMAQPAFGSGFGLIEQSVTGLGNAFAGSVAVSEDASTIYFNPAGLTFLPDNSIMGGAYLISPTVRFSNEGSTAVNGVSLRGSNGGEAGEDSFVPNFYAAWSVSERIKLGLGVNVPFGLATKYEEDWVGRYQAVTSELKTININPTVAAKVTDELSIGLGLNIQYADAKLTNAIDFGAIALAAGFPSQPQSADGFLEVQGNDWSFGYNIGLLYAPSPDTRIGLAYRSGLEYTLEGEADFTTPQSAALLTRNGLFTDTDVKARLKTPDSLSLGFYQKVTPKIAVLGDVTWTNWSRFDELRIQYDNPVQPDSVQPENWEDTMRIGLGVNYLPNENLTLRAGVAYDQSPVRDDFRTPRIPDNDRFWLALGLSYRPTESLSFDVGYAHLFVGDANIDQVNVTGDRLRGDIGSDVDIIGVQVNWRF
ncbi:aromatic hydrocarbon degradation protein [Candidatus Gracilibacteria bacterium]|jgi:long-chain fatty acid transport protein|nr:aromatic hydrocarbon degradation protein [Candidatus Gracilibacteria bacterium]NJM86451.1 aromatic hydrocarbon degradation protein [Hydrococcus sp. RU_2_2]NJP17992.1 aromatic hydrocarbon degradation protein [Hydrococcus sp. CRU_1_1]NJQ96839.1 aromatic hydrocarbon degradation protein [Hydrococcus sp. CSU_1_8]